MNAFIEEIISQNIKNEFRKPSEREIEEAKQILIKNKNGRFTERMMERTVNKWKEQELHCGVTGSGGSGKSSIINAIRNLKGEDVGAAEVGVTETTKVPTPYKDPNNSKIVYWDLPGVGTTSFPKDKTYLKKIGFEKYDFFFIISSTRFTENDAWLAKQIRDAGKRFYFIRTKLDLDIASEKREYERTEEDVRKKIKNDCIDCLKRQGISDPQVYLISNWFPKDYEFPNLIIELTKSLPLHKREAMTLSIHAFSKEIIFEKKKILEAKTYLLSSFSALGATIQLPGLSLAADFTLIMKELSNYREHFGLRDEDLKKYKIPAKKIGFIAALSTKEAVIKLFGTFASSTAAEEVCRFIPIIGPLIASGLSFATTYSMLNILLNKMANASLEIMETRFEIMIKKTENDSPI